MSDQAQAPGWWQASDGKWWWAAKGTPTGGVAAAVTLQSDTLLINY